MSHPIRRRLAAAALRAIGWSINFSGWPAPRGVVVAYPHTSNWDFVVGLLAIWSIELDVKFVGKHTLFRWPFGKIMRAWGGLPIDRRSPQGAIRALADLIRSQPHCWVAIAPEGTRRLTAGWRSGFYHLAKELDVPIGLGVIDYGGKQIILERFVQPDAAGPDETMAEIARYYEPFRGFRHGNAAPIKLVERGEQKR